MLLNGVKSEYNRLPFFVPTQNFFSGCFNRDTDEWFNERLVFNKFQLHANNILSNIPKFITYPNQNLQLLHNLFLIRIQLCD